MKLPLKYIETMKTLLGAEYDAYLASFDEERFYGLRVNTLKISAEEMAAKGVFSLRSVPWCETGFYYDGGRTPCQASVLPCRAVLFAGAKRHEPCGNAAD